MMATHTAHKARRFVLGLVGGAVTGACSRVLTRRWNPENWQRPSYRGRPVQLTGGLDAAVGAVAGQAVTARSLGDAAGIVAALAGAGAGAVDDHLEARFPARGKGFHGHLGALREGKMTSGLLKIAGIGAGAGVAALMLSADSRRSGFVDVPLNTALIAGTANLVNLLDLRPGRALKVTVAASGVAAGAYKNTGGAGALIGSSIVALPSDLAGKTMLGDLGANALGAQLGAVIASCSSRRARLAVLGIVITLTVLSEKVSFSDVIEKNPVLRAIDQLGRPCSSGANSNEFYSAGEEA